MYKLRVCRDLWRGGNVLRPNPDQAGRHVRSGTQEGKTKASIVDDLEAKEMEGRDCRIRS